jgi:hypothetical protein
MSKWLEAAFPGLASGRYHITSRSNWRYNCIAWAAGQTTDWWWPGPNAAVEHWPEGVPRELSLPAFQQAFETLDYSVCAAEEQESGFQKIALYADANGQPTHAARQLPEGNWTSKLGNAEDIEHELRALEGDTYGTVVLFMKRPLE